MSAKLDALAARTFFAPVASIRPYLVLKGTLLLLAFDLWLTRIESGGRYSGAFNTAHFAILDWVQPPVSSELYVGLLVGTGLLCVVLAIAPRPPHWLIGLTFVLHTWTWAMSMLDSYQHHYLLSIVLLALAFFPRLTAEQALVAPAKAPPPAPAPTEAKPKDKKRRPKKESKKVTPTTSVGALAILAPAPRTSAWAYVSLSFSIAIVYAYTAYSKTADEWLAGTAFKRVLQLNVDGTAPAGVEDYIAPVRGLASVFGIEGDTFWWFMGHSVVLVQIVCCAGYMLAPFLDVTTNRFVKLFAPVALFTALSFHLGAEYMELKIGWFSWYMVGYALVYMLPGRWLAVAARALIPLEGQTFAIEGLAIRIGLGLLFLVGVGYWTPFGVVGGGLLSMTVLRPFVNARAGVLGRVPWYVFALSALVGACALCVVGFGIDLPGAPIVGAVGAVALVGAGSFSLFARSHARTVHAYGVGALVGACVCAVAIGLSPVRADLYRKLSGFQRRIGEPVPAYIAAVKANRYAPRGARRYRWEYLLRRQLAEQGRLPEVDGE